MATLRNHQTMWVGRTLLVGIFVACLLLAGAQSAFAVTSGTSAVGTGAAYQGEWKQWRTTIVSAFEGDAGSDGEGRVFVDANVEEGTGYWFEVDIEHVLVEGPYAYMAGPITAISEDLAEHLGEYQYFCVYDGDGLGDPDSVSPGIDCTEVEAIGWIAGRKQPTEYGGMMNVQEGDYVVGGGALNPLAGATRVETAIEVSKAAFPGGADTVVIGTGRNWPDALGGAALAGAEGGPILLSDTDSLPDSTMAEIDRLGATEAIILGGTGAISSAAEEALKSRLGADSVTRIGGADRYETAHMVAEAAIDAMGNRYDGTAFAATGGDFPDALAGAPLAAANGWPIYLVPPAGSAPTAIMQAAGVSDVLILGGTGVVSGTAEDAFGTAFGADAVMRLAGATRYSTAVEIATHGVGSAGLHWDGVAIATGEIFPDALTGGVLQGRTGSVMLLTPGSELSPDTETALRANKDAIAEVKFLGGTGAVSQTVRDQVVQALQ